MQKFLNEAQSLKDKSDAELNQLRAVVLNRSLDPLNLSRYPESALRVFFLLLRNQEAPSFLEKKDLTQLCSKWSCKRKQFWCFLEAQGEQLYADVGFKADQCLGQRKSIQPAAMVLAADNIFELRPNAASLRNLHVTKVKETMNAHVNGIFNGAMGHSQCLIKPEPMDDEDLLHTQDTSPGTVNERHPGMHVNEELTNCYCEACSRDPLFCYGCSCSLCRELISQTEIWSFIRCIECSHVCHLECAWKARKAGVVKEMGLDGEFLCPSCLEKNDLITFWKERVKGAVTSMDSFMLEKQLFSAVVLLNGTQREMYESIHGQLRDLHSAVVNNAPSLHIQQTLCEIGEKLNALPDSQMPSDVFGELSQIVPTGFQSVDLLALEAKVFEYQKIAELNYAEWLEAEKHAETQRSLFKDAEERLKKAEEDTNIRADYAKASKKLWQRSKSRLLLLKRSFKAKVTSKEQIELHKKVLDTELMELGRLQDQLKSFNSRSSNFPGRDFPSLKDDLKVQRKRIQAAQAMLEHIIFLENFFL
ncbi:hypothetical protein O6H91_14G036800 [Diphasiastrum complanatum]|nr:hypothetical protein O6H91_14G036800 [Diphasiastrum complanatum]